VGHTPRGWAANYYTRRPTRRRWAPQAEGYCKKMSRWPRGLRVPEVHFRRSPSGHAREHISLAWRQCLSCSRISRKPGTEYEHFHAHFFNTIQNRYSYIYIYEYLFLLTHIYPISMNNSKKLSWLNLKIYKIDHQKYLVIDGDLTSKLLWFSVDSSPTGQTNIGT
jgi:hypothetical protein